MRPGPQSRADPTSLRAAIILAYGRGQPLHMPLSTPLLRVYCAVLRGRVFRRDHANEATVKKISLLLSLLGLSLASVAMADTTKNISPYPVGERSVFSERATIDRIKPVGDVCVEGKPCDVSAAAAAPAAAGGGAPRTGDQVFGAVCTNCHTAGVMGAPKFGNKGDWGPRISKGKPTLYTHALNGFNMMPAHGTCMTCSDAEIKAAVDYMVSKAQ
jgi:cytochrome c5